MNSAFSGIELGKRALITHQAALQVTGHNVSNADTEGYSRQKITLEVFDPLYIPGLTRELTPGQIGQGVDVQKILRARDMLLDDRIISEKNGLSYWTSMNSWVKQVELVHNEPSDKSIMHLLDKFWASWQDLANNPEENSAREAVREYGIALSRQINNNYMALKSIRDNIEETIQARVYEVNSLAKDIAKLNAEILKSESVGDNPNDLWDKRDLLVENLSKLTDIQIGRSDKDEFIIYINGKHLVQGKHYEQLKLVKNPNNEGYSDIVWNRDGTTLKVKSGELKSLLDARDEVVKKQIDDLDLFTVNLMDMVNSIHRKGFGINLRTGLNFFKENAMSVNPVGDYDFNGDGLLDSTIIFRITGSQKIKPDDTVGISGTITLNNEITVNYKNTDRVSDIISRINNSGADIKMFVNSYGNLVVKSDGSNLYINHLEDSGDFLVKYAGILKNSGSQGAFDVGAPGMAQRIGGDYMVTQMHHPSSWLTLDDGVKNEVESIAASTGVDTDGDGVPDVMNGAGNGDNALKIAGVRFERIMVGKSLTLNDFYQRMITEIGLKGEIAKRESENRGIIVDNLVNMRKSISGVNMDEELVNMVKFQHGYAAAARFVSEMNKMLDIIINRML
ncbi:MAG: flagellar hook-associated protein FlgK [Spirochaetes bacterium]|nr:MAG: flagellar hook-associated protein FlgK [Spirochaetota bacterium]